MIKNELLLEVNNLSTFFKTEEGFGRAVDDISFKINKGETVGIVGESGSGKSVTALSIIQLIPHPMGTIAHGEVYFNSSSKGKINLLAMPEKALVHLRGKEVSMIFQEPMTSLNPVYTCGDQIIEAILLHQKINRKQAKEKTLQLLSQVDLPNPEEIYSSYPHQLSGGQKQRVMIAIAISCHPQLLIADEPTTALDVTVQARILALLKKLRDQTDMSMLFISHDLGVIAEIADKVIVMYQGKIVEQGTVWEIFSNPQHPYTKGLLACRPRMDFKLKVLPTVADFMDINHKGEITENKNKYNSVGQALLFNFTTDEEIEQRQNFLDDQEPLLVVKNLKTYFPVTTGIFKTLKGFNKAVDDVSFEVRKGETLGLVGESGCGKTTLGRSILRLIEPIAGEIFLEGKDILKFKRHELQKLRKKIQIVFQDPYSSLNPRMTIGEAILEPMRFNEILNSDYSRKRRVIELLETVSMKAEHFDRYPHEFSGGQRQRISIARALAMNPQFIICDESVSALDVSVQAQVLNLLNNLKEEFNFTYIFISHNLAVVKFIADRIIIMKQGKIVESGYAEDVYANPQSPYTQKLIDAIPKGDLEEIRKAQLKRGATNLI